MKQMVYVYIRADCQSCAVTDAFHRLSAVVALFAKVTRRSEELKWEVDFFLFATIYNICCYKRQTNTNSTRFFQQAACLSGRTRRTTWQPASEFPSQVVVLRHKTIIQTEQIPILLLQSLIFFFNGLMTMNGLSSSTSSGCPFFLETAQSGVLAILKGLSSTPSTATDRFWPRLGLSSHWYNRSSASADHDPCMPRGHRANAAWIAWILCPNSCAETPRRDSWHTRVPCWICAMMSIVLGGCLSKRLKVGTVAEVDAEDMDVGAKRRHFMARQFDRTSYIEFGRHSFETGVSEPLNIAVRPKWGSPNSCHKKSIHTRHKSIWFYSKHFSR